jgi:hypothetical protein
MAAQLKVLRDNGTDGLADHPLRRGVVPLEDVQDG